MLPRMSCTATAVASTLWCTADSRVSTAQVHKRVCRAAVPHIICSDRIAGIRPLQHVQRLPGEQLHRQSGVRNRHARRITLSTEYRFAKSSNLRLSLVDSYSLISCSTHRGKWCQSARTLVWRGGAERAPALAQPQRPPLRGRRARSRTVAAVTHHRRVRQPPASGSRACGGSDT